MKLVLDTNVYIAAFLGKGLALNIFRLGQRKKVQLFTSRFILDELKGKLASKFKVEKSLINDFLRLVQQSSVVVKPKQTLKVIKKDPEDNKVLECALEAQANLIISMDRHLLKLKSYGKIGIVHPKTLTWIIPKILDSS